MNVLDSIPRIILRDRIFKVRSSMVVIASLRPEVILVVRVFFREVD